MMTTKTFLRRSSLECLEGRRMLAGDFVAGDANQDYYFDEADFVLASKGGKFDSGDSATWQEGDWTGDGEYTSRDFVAAFVAGKYGEGAYDEDAGEPVSELAPLATEGEADVTVYYASTTGNVAVAATTGAMTTIHLYSPSGIFQPGPFVQRGLFDIHNPNTEFRLEPNGKPVYQFYVALETGLTEQQLLAELRVDGGMLGGGGLGTVRLSVVDTLPPELDSPELQNVTHRIVDIEEANGVLYYNPDTGDITIAGIAVRTATIELISQSRIFVGTETTDYTEGLFDVARPEKFFRLNPKGDASVHLPGIARTGLTADEITSDLEVNGSLSTGGRLLLALSMPNGPNADFVAPEPLPPGENPGENPDENPVFVPNAEFPFVAMEDANGILTYDASSGDVVISAVDSPFTAIELISQAGAFVGTETTDYREGLFDVANLHKVFKLDPGGMSIVELPGIARTGLTIEEVGADFSHNGSVLGGGRLKLALATPALAATIADCHLHLDDGEILGDANLDGVFDSQDLVQVFQAGQYSDDIDGNSGWADGDWNCNGDFDSSDFVVAFEADTFVGAAAAVPAAMSNVGDRHLTVASDAIVVDEVDAKDGDLATRHRSRQLESGNAGVESILHPRRHEIQQRTVSVVAVDELMETF